MRILILSILICTHTAAWATWSIIIIDAKTGTIGIAGASCSRNCYGIGTIVPGKGAVIVQAMSNSEAREKGVQLLLTDKSPEEIIAALRDARFDPERQQYAVVSLLHLTPATYTGTETHTSHGALTAPGISVQGNTLTSDSVLHRVMQVIVDAQKKALTLDVILMLALEAGSDAGGDKRCGAQRATSAFITLYRKDDKRGKPHLNMNTFGQSPGGHNAVTLLRKQYDRWKNKHGNE